MNSWRERPTKPSRSHFEMFVELGTGEFDCNIISVELCEFSSGSAIRVYGWNPSVKKSYNEILKESIQTLKLVSMLKIVLNPNLKSIYE